VIYADNAATTKISDSVFEKMLPFLREQYGNPSSQYSLGAKAKHSVELARKQVATAIGAEPKEIFFTSGGSETNSWVLKGVTEKYHNEPVHIIVSAIEHHSVLNTCHALEKKDVDVTYLPVNRTGEVSVASVEAAIKPHTKLVSIIFANNEIGTIQPIAEIGYFLQEKGIIFHSDAVQAVGHIPIYVNNLHVDLLTASAHKFNGAKGTGILYKRSGLEFLPLVFGGKQEHGLRAGTENVAGIVAAGYALEESLIGIKETAKRLQEMVTTTISRLRKKIPRVKVNGDAAQRLPGLLNLSFDGVSGESLMHLLDLKGVCVSTSSACSSGEDKPSHVLLALGLSEKQSKSSIRISYGKYNNVEDAEAIVTAICEAYEKIMTTRFPV
jgi:cysteine desulfurase